MNKLKNVFQRSSTKIKAVEDRRPQQFVKRHSIVTPIATPVASNDALPPPAINLSDLSEMEKQAYQSWWKDLDPFDLQKINNQTILKFLNGCSLPDNKLEQILALFETAGDGLNKLQFLAMLRLIAHAQNGRKISRALVYLGAPIPQFHTNAIDALIKTDLPQRQFMNSNPSQPPPPSNHQQHGVNKKAEEESLDYNSGTNQATMAAANRKSWWGNEKEQLVDSNRRSYMGPFTAHTPIPNGPFNSTSNSDNSMKDYFYPLPPINNNTTTTPNTPYNTFSPDHLQQQQWRPSDSDNTTPNLIISTSMRRPNITSSVTTTATITPITPNIIQREEKSNAHSRSKSAGTASDFIQTFHNPYHHPSSLSSNQPAAAEEVVLQSSRSSLSLHELNTGQSLLLTQKFVYQSPSLRYQEATTTTIDHSNPFNIPTPTVEATEEVIVSPFDDENSDDSMDLVIEEQQQQRYAVNAKPNSRHIPPPPVPSQSNKPAFPKYTRTNTFLLKRSQSNADGSSARHSSFSQSSSSSSSRHQRHKSTSAAENIFY